MGKFRCKQYAKLLNQECGSTISIHNDIKSTWNEAANNNTKNNRYNFSDRYRFKLQPVKLIKYGLLALLNVFPTAAYGTDVGGVSATANPVANSSGSVTNQAIQVLQGPYITDTFGGGVSCQGPTLNITPFLTQTKSWQFPYEPTYNDPVYNNADNNDDGIPDNPGQVLYHIPTRTGQKDQHNWNWGLSATVSIPLDGGIQERCKTAATNQNNINHQILVNKRLDFEMARLKHCAEQRKLGVTFHPQSPSAKICADIVVTNPHGVIPQHSHSIPTNPSSSSSVPLQLDSSLSGEVFFPSKKVPLVPFLVPSESSPSPSLSSA